MTTVANPGVVFIWPFEPGRGIGYSKSVQQDLGTLCLVFLLVINVLQQIFPDPSEQACDASHDEYWPTIRGPSMPWIYVSLCLV